MRTLLNGLVLGSVSIVAACVTETKDPVAVADGGARRYTQSRIESSVACAGVPVVAAGDRNRLTFTGGCDRVTVAGRRNDVMVEVAPGGVIEITGERNAVGWRQIGTGPAPVLRDLGRHNEFWAAGP